jgi:hypothetical protein
VSGSMKEVARAKTMLVLVRAHAAVGC